MSEFLDWHPSSANAHKLYKESKDIVKIIYNSPVEGISYLQEKWNFGAISEIWDDFVFETCVRPVLDKNSSDDLESSIRRYYLLDHKLFLPYIRREENPIRFRRAFWNVNFYGQRLASKMYHNLNSKSSTRPASLEKQGNHTKLKIAFVLKGLYRLAHVEFLHSFLSGCSIFKNKISVSLLLLDEDVSAVASLNHVNVTSFRSFGDPFAKISEYIKHVNAQSYDHICWVACVQNLSLYMGMQLAPTQSYWSMKYHSIIIPTIQKYAGLGFGGSSFIFDDVNWFRGRAFPELSMPAVSKSDSDALRSSKKIPVNSIIVGCFVRAEKLHDPNFWKSIVQILEYSKNVHFAIASQYLPQGLKSLVSNTVYSSRFHHLGWINTKLWASVLDIYYDSAPRGSCNTIFEAIEAGTPVLMADSAHNRESSALPYLLSSFRSISNIDDNVPGVFNDETSRLKACFNLIDRSDHRAVLASSQGQLLQNLKGQQHLFAKDYLNHFLDLNLQLSDLK